MSFVPTHIEMAFRRGSEREYVTNHHGPVVVHAIDMSRGWFGQRVPRAIIEYDRYNGSSSPLGLWTRVIEEVPLSELWEVLA